MVMSQGAAHSVRRRLAWKLMTGAAIVFVTAGCARIGKKDGPAQRLAAFDYSKQARRPPLKPSNPMIVAASKWANKHQKNPADPNAALNYARALRALGSRDKALEVLARTYQLNTGNKELASEYGRLALDMGKVQLAERLLEQAQRAKGQTDWRVLSALGTLRAKRGDHKEAQSYYVAALRQKPDATSVYNNLALSYALDGRVGDAEELLKRAVAKGHNTRRMRQNLALVLGLQSKFGEAQKIAQADLNEDKIDNNESFMRNMVKPAKVARAGTVKHKAGKPGSSVATESRGHTKAGTITTASLPAKKKKAAAGKSAEKKAPAKKLKVASTRGAGPGSTTAKSKTAKIATILPRRKKPAAAPDHTRTARASVKSPDAPTSILPQANTNWSVTVTEGVASRPGPEGTGKASGEFEFPGTE